MPDNQNDGQQSDEEQSDEDLLDDLIEDDVEAILASGEVKDQPTPEPRSDVDASNDGEVAEDLLRREDPDNEFLSMDRDEFLDYLDRRDAASAELRSGPEAPEGSVLSTEEMDEISSRPSDDDIAISTGERRAAMLLAQQRANELMERVRASVRASVEGEPETSPQEREFEEMNLTNMARLTDDQFRRFLAARDAGVSDLEGADDSVLYGLVRQHGGGRR